MLKPKKYITDDLSRASFIFRVEMAVCEGIPMVGYETVLLAREDTRPSNRPRVPGE